jgi:hypothetical protein
MNSYAIVGPEYLQHTFTTEWDYKKQCLLLLKLFWPHGLLRRVLGILGTLNHTLRVVCLGSTPLCLYFPFSPVFLFFLSDKVLLCIPGWLESSQSGLKLLILQLSLLNTGILDGATTPFIILSFIKHSGTFQHWIKFATENEESPNYTYVTKFMREQQPPSVFVNVG